MQVGSRVRCVGGFRETVGMYGEIIDIQYVTASEGSAGYVCTVVLDDGVIEPRSGRVLDTFWYDSNDLEEV